MLPVAFARIHDDKARRPRRPAGPQTPLRFRTSIYSAGDGIGVGDDLKDTHAAAVLTAESDRGWHRRRARPLLGEDRDAASKARFLEDAVCDPNAVYLNRRPT